MNETEVFAYMMAAEKMVNMLSVMEQNIEFYEEYKVKPDEEVKKALIPLLQKWEKWLKS